jgi:hypothetical protein
MVVCTAPSGSARTTPPDRLRKQGCLRLHRRCIATVARACRSELPLGVAPGRPGKVPGSRGWESDHEEDTSPWKERATCHSQGCRAQRTRSQRNASKSRISPDTPPLLPTSNGEQGANVPGETQRQGGSKAAVTRYWLRTGGTLRRVEASRGARPAFAPARIADHSRVASGGDPGGAGLRETRRTPRPAAGCNKPANFSAEKTVEVVRNHAGGTRQDGWCRRPEGSDRATGCSLEWTRRSHVGGGAVKSRNPKRGRAQGARSELRLWSAPPRGARLPCGRFVGEGNGQGVPTTDGLPS